MTSPHDTADDKAHDQPKAFFFYLADKIESSKPVATGAEIKAMIHAVVPAFDVTHTLILEGKGNAEDEVIADNQEVSLAVTDPQGPKHFYSKPPTNFG